MASASEMVWLSHFIPYPPTSGALERSYHLLQAAARTRAVHLLAFDQPRLRQSATTVDDAVNELRAVCASVRVLPIPFERNAATRALAQLMSVPVSVPYDQLWLRSAAMHEAARELAARAAIGLVHVDTLALVPYARHFPTARIVLNHHNVESSLVARRAEREHAPWRRLALRREARKLREVERASCGAAAANLVVSDLDRSRLEAVSPSCRAFVVANGVDTTYFAPGDDPGPAGGVAFVGTLAWHANRDAARLLVTEIWPALKLDGQPRRLTLIGRDPRRADWGEAGRDVTTTGYVEDIRPYLHRACSVVCPINEGGGTRLKVLVALAMGKPLVATATAVEGLNLLEERHYLRAETVDAFVAQIRRLEQQPDLRHRLAEAGRDLVRSEYDWTIVAMQLEQAYAAASAAKPVSAAETW
jgi:glycosyltransferase involved in cell wall biosynthesis